MQLHLYPGEMLHRTPLREAYFEHPLFVVVDGCLGEMFPLSEPRQRAAPCNEGVPDGGVAGEPTHNSETMTL
jgi:hypothetical protein